jgi:non-ribosomal peptide synthetase component F
VRPQDRVYQGFSLAFDASVEEIWLAFFAGATLVAGTREMVYSGPNLSRHLTEAGVTVFSTVPTQLAMMTEDSPRANASKFLNLWGDFHRFLKARYFFLVVLACRAGAFRRRWAGALRFLDFCRV